VACKTSNTRDVQKEGTLL